MLRDRSRSNRSSYVSVNHASLVDSDKTGKIGSVMYLKISSMNSYITACDVRLMFLLGHQVVDILYNSY